MLIFTPTHEDGVREREEGRSGTPEVEGRGGGVSVEQKRLGEGRGGRLFRFHKLAPGSLNLMFKCR